MSKADRIKSHLFFIFLSLIWLYFCWLIIQAGYTADGYAQTFFEHHDPSYPLSKVTLLLVAMTVQLMMLIGVELSTPHKWRFAAFLTVNLLFLVPSLPSWMHSSPAYSVFVVWQVTLFLLIVFAIIIHVFQRLLYAQERKRIDKYSDKLENKQPSSNTDNHNK